MPREVVRAEPTLVAVPPPPTAATPAPPPQDDPFSFPISSSSSAFKESDVSWDAFDDVVGPSSSSAPNSAVADAAAAPSSAVAVAASPAAPPAAFQADFGNFSGQRQNHRLPERDKTSAAFDVFHGTAAPSCAAVAAVVPSAPPAAFQADFGNFSGQLNNNSTENDRASAFDAFDGLSLTPTPTEIAPIARVNDECTVSSNSHDDVSPTTTAAALLEETSTMLQKLNAQQLMQVRQLIANIMESSSSAPSNDGHHNATAAGASPFAGNEIQTKMNASQKRQQQINMAFGELVPMQSFLPAAKSGPRFSMQQHQAHPIPRPVQSASAPGQYFSTEQHFNDGIPQQAMGVSNNNQAAVPTGSIRGPPPDATLSSSPPPPPPVVAAFASPALPLVEKEGNPFDF
jgi:hypothetical protein